MQATVFRSCQRCRVSGPRHRPREGLSGSLTEHSARGRVLGLGVTEDGRAGRDAAGQPRDGGGGSR